MNEDAEAIEQEQPAELAVPASPVVESRRIDAMDVVRGFALVGIFMVNIQSFGQAFGEFILPAPRPNEPMVEKVAFYLEKTLCEGKFYPLFSMLFGMGLMLQYQAAMNANRGFARLGARRLFILMAFGAMHALLLWYGDILFIYSWVGLVLLMFLRFRARVLFAISAGVMILMLVIGGFVMSMMGDAPNADLHVPPPAKHFADPFGRVWQAAKDDQLHQGPSTPIWVQTETQVYRKGPYDQLFKFRAASWIAMLVFCVFGFGWSVVSMVFLGAAMMKAGIFHPDNRRWFARFAIVGLGVGLPASILAARLPALVAGKAGTVGSGVLGLFAGPLLSLGYFGAWCLIVNRECCSGVTRLLANAGRMALTNYLCQSLIATTIFYYYGLGLFGRTTRVERIGIVLAVYLLQLLFSSLWLRYFQFGPMEWVWRSLTYRKLQPFQR